MNEPDHNPTPQQLEDIVRQLDRRDVAHWLPEMKWGKPVYEYLKTALLSEEINVNQIQNVMIALFKLRFHGNSEEVLRLYMRFVDDDRLKVRSKAVRLAVSLARMHLDYPNHAAPLEPEDRARIEGALSRGVDAQTEGLARSILGGA